MAPRIDRIGVRDVGAETPAEIDFEAAVQNTTTGNVSNIDNIAMTTINIIASSPLDPSQSLA